MIVKDYDFKTKSCRRKRTKSDIMIYGYSSNVSKERMSWGFILYFVYSLIRGREIRSSTSPEVKMQMEMSVAIANQIYEILEAKGMSQKDLAHRLGKTETEMSRWLSGMYNLTLATICKISSALGEDVVKVAEYETESVCV